MKSRQAWEGQGKLFAYEHFDITPDLMTLAKALGNGFCWGPYWNR